MPGLKQLQTKFVLLCIQTQVLNKRTGQWKSGYAADQDPSGALLPWILQEYKPKFELARRRELLGTTSVSVCCAQIKLASAADCRFAAW